VYQVRIPDRPWFNYACALAITGACTALAFPFYPKFDSVNIVMLYLLATTVGALRLGRGPSVLLAVANMLAFDYYFVPPVFSFDVDDEQYFFTMGVMLFVALVIANLMINVSRHRELADSRERRTRALYAMSRELAVATDAPALAAAAVRHMRDVFHCTAAVLVADRDGHLSVLASGDDADGDGPDSLMERLDLQYAEEAAVLRERSVQRVIYQPMHTGDRVQGVIAVLPRSGVKPLLEEQLDLLGAFAVQLASALQRVQLVEAAEAARTSEKQALLRNTLLASISHDLRTPLAAIAGAGSLIAQPDYALDTDRRIELGQLIEQRSRDMSQQLSNVLELMQMEHGSTVLRADWHAIEDLVGHSLKAHEARLSQWHVRLALPPDLPLILVDATLVVQILNNLLENASKYTPPGTTITISAEARDGGLSLAISDNGPGLPPGQHERLFEKFQRGHPESNVVGVGLGLAICRAAARLHGGDVCACENPGGGARFEIELPVAMQADAQPSTDSDLQRIWA
jgi:two-component system, OmpR family, sensor histidine kinase KdpD